MPPLTTRRHLFSLEIMTFKNLFFALFLGAIASNLAANPYDELIAELVSQDSPVCKIAVVELIARGPGSEGWKDATLLVRGKIEEALGARKSIVLIDRDNISLIDQENALTGKNTKVIGTDAFLTGFIMLVDRKVILSLTKLDIATQKKQTASTQLEPFSLGINVETDLPPADASIRIANAVMFDIVRNLVKAEALSAATTGNSDPDFNTIVAKRRKVLENEVEQWAGKSIEEIQKLIQLDPTIVKRGFTDRREYLILEGQLQQADTTRQQRLIVEFEVLYERARKSGIETTTTMLISTCKKGLDQEK